MVLCPAPGTGRTAGKNASWPAVPWTVSYSRDWRRRIDAVPEATPLLAEWLRRVALDLTGLPPTPRDYADYLADRAKDPPRCQGARGGPTPGLSNFGERWAALWLDLARYSDTYGFEKDPHRDIWPWRDWVIRAFNADMPFDQFTIRQLAGDQLEHPYGG